jgi:hypothetical protein
MVFQQVNARRLAARLSHALARGAWRFMATVLSFNLIARQVMTLALDNALHYTTKGMRE